MLVARHQDQDREGLLRHARAGDRVAFGLLLHLEAGMLAKLLAVRLGVSDARHPEVEDILQQTAARAFVGLHGLEGKSGAAWRAWLRRIALNCVQDRLRRLGRERGARCAQEEGWEGELPERAASGGALRAADQNGNERALYCLRHLAFEERMAMSLRVFRALSWESTHMLLKRPTQRSARSFFERVRLQLRAGLRSAGIG